MEITSFKEIVKKYKVIFFDSYGVLRNYKGIFPNIPEMFNMLESQGIKSFLLTNDASRSPKELAAKFQKSGITAFSDDKVISSGMLAREYICRKISGGTIVYLGTESSAQYIQINGVKTISIHDVDLDKDDNYQLLVLLDDEGYDWNRDLSKTVNLLRRYTMPIIVANSDTTYPLSKDKVAIATGGVANLLESLVQKVFIRFGKPDSQMYSFAFDHIQQFGTIEKKDILMVGDTLQTDILGGNKFGIDTCLVLSGNTLPKNVELEIASTGIIPNYICSSVIS
ncbi:MAG: TIGR01459 family HAD-type hydrolase [Bacteroidales bacterium]|nr:TIGR01459 family HAD-type hydrolase [Bacteroidales bacterium]